MRAYRTWAPRWARRSGLLCLVGAVEQLRRTAQRATLRERKLASVPAVLALVLALARATSTATGRPLRMLARMLALSSASKHACSPSQCGLAAARFQITSHKLVPRLAPSHGMEAKLNCTTRGSPQRCAVQLSVIMPCRMEAMAVV